MSVGQITHFLLLKISLVPVKAEYFKVLKPALLLFNTLSFFTANAGGQHCPQMFRLCFS